MFQSEIGKMTIDFDDENPKLVSAVAYPDEDGTWCVELQYEDKSVIPLEVK